MVCARYTATNPFAAIGCAVCPCLLLPLCCELPESIAVDDTSATITLLAGGEQRTMTMADIESVAFTATPECGCCACARGAGTAAFSATATCCRCVTFDTSRHGFLTAAGVSVRVRSRVGANL